MPVYKYIRLQRVNAAKTLLQGSQLSIAEIALAVGYKKPGAFSKAFKQITGVTPSEFRAS